MYVNNKSYKKHKYFELAILVTIILFVVGSILADLSVVKLPSRIIASAKKPEEFYLTLFSVQATVATISIAIIALISGFSAENIYGIYVSYYILHIKPCFLKHRTLIIMILSSIFFNYIALSQKFYNTSISIFVSNIILLVFMAVDVLEIFSGKHNLQLEIKNYIIEHYTTQYLSELHDDIINAIDSNNIITVKDDIQLLVIIFEKEIATSTACNISEDLKCIETIFSDTYIKIQGSMSPVENYKLLIVICNLYKTANGIKGKPIPLDIWDNIKDKYFKFIATMPFEQIQENFVITDMHRQLYLNFDVLSSKSGQFPINCYDLEYYSCRVYYYLFKYQNNVHFSDEQSVYIKRYLYEDINRLLSYHNFADNNDFKKKTLQLELQLYIKMLIDNGEKETIKKQFFNSLVLNRNVLKLFFVPIVDILIYLYYLAEREDLIKGKKLQQYAKDIIYENKSFISEFLFLIDFNSLSNLDYNYIQSTLEKWEIMEGESAKWIIMEFVIQDFMIFTTITKYWNYEQIYPLLKLIVKDNPFPLYERHFSNDDKLLEENYKDFIILMMHTNINAESSKLEYYKYALSKIYRDTEIKNGILQEQPVEKIEDYQHKLETTVKAQASTLLGLFSQINVNKDIIKTSPLQLGELELPVSCLSESPESDDNIIQYIQNCVVRSLLFILKKHLKIQPIRYDSRNIQKELFELVKEVNVNINTVVGNREEFWGEDDPEQFKNFSKNMIHIQYPAGYNELSLFDRKLLYFHIKNVQVKIEDLSENEIDKYCKVSENGTNLYNVTNDIYIPIDKHDLIDHIHRIRKKIIITSDVEYAILNEIVGAAIYITTDE